MIRAQLVVGGNQSERSGFAQEVIKKHLGKLKHPDLLVVEADPSVTIGQAREIKKTLAHKPYSASIKIVFLPEAEKLTLPAQNALLKTLEEPPGEALIILLAPKREALLPTILSRCQITKLSDKVVTEIDDSLISQSLNISISILNSGVGERLVLSEEQASSRKQAIDFCQKQLVAWRQIMRGEVSSISQIGQLMPSQITQTLRQIHQALNFLKANVNAKLVVENLLLFLPEVKNQKNCG